MWTGRAMYGVRLLDTNWREVKMGKTFKLELEGGDLIHMLEKFIKERKEQ